MEDNIPKQSWWKRNWKWALPTGGCLTVLIVFGIMVGGAVWGVSNALTKSQPSIDGLERAKKNEEVILTLGSPLEVKGIPSGNYHYENNIKTTEVSIPIEGPKGEGTLRVDGEAVDDVWTYSVMKVIIEQPDETIEIDLLKEANAGF